MSLLLLLWPRAQKHHTLFKVRPEKHLDPNMIYRCLLCPPGRGIIGGGEIQQLWNPHSQSSFRCTLKLCIWWRPYREIQAGHLPRVPNSCDEIQALLPSLPVSPPHPHNPSSNQANLASSLFFLSLVTGAGGSMWSRDTTGRVGRWGGSGGETLTLHWLLL